VVYDDTAKNVQVNIVNPVPEPGTAGLLAVGALGLLARRRRVRAR
jgi:PEP-CTERM motif